MHTRPWLQARTPALQRPLCILGSALFQVFLRFDAPGMCEAVSAYACAFTLSEEQELYCYENSTARAKVCSVWQAHALLREDGADLVRMLGLTHWNGKHGRRMGILYRWMATDREATHAPMLPPAIPLSRRVHRPPVFNFFLEILLKGESARSMQLHF